MLGTCGTPWELSTPNGIVSSVGSSEATLDQSVKSLEESRVTGFEVRGDILDVSFSNQCGLRIVPTAEDAQEHEVPYWELFMPYNMFVEFRPGGIWSYKRSDLPIT